MPSARRGSVPTPTSNARTGPRSSSSSRSGLGASSPGPSRSTTRAWPSAAWPSGTRRATSRRAFAASCLSLLCSVARTPAEPAVEPIPRRRRDARTFRSVLCRGGRAAEPIVEPTREPTAEPRTPSTPSPRRSNNRRHKASELSVWRAVFGKGAIEKDKKKREKRKQRHEAERTRMAVVYNCFAHLESIARFPRPVGSCVFVLLARCRARLAWTYPYDSAITRDILPPNTPSTQALEVMNCYAEEAPDRFPTSACRRGVVSRGLSTR